MTGVQTCALPISRERLKVIEMKPDAKFTSRDFGGIGAALYDCCYNDCIPSRRFGSRRQNDAVANANVCIGGESLIDCNRALRRLQEKRCGEYRNDHALKLAGGSMLAASQATS